jgi:hypothetical protein
VFEERAGYVTFVLSLAATYREIQVLMATAAFVLGVGGIFFVCIIMLFFIVLFWTFIGFCMGRNISVGGTWTGGGGEVCVCVVEYA